MTKRTYKRRSDNEIISDLEAEIERQKARIQARERPDQVVLKELPRIKKRLASYAQLCMDHGRNDLSNTLLAFLMTFESQAKQDPA